MNRNIFKRPPVERDAHEVRLLLADGEVVEVVPRRIERAGGGLILVEAALIDEPKIGRKPRGDLDGIVPRDLRDRVRALLQPAVVGIAPIVDLQIGDETDFEVLNGERGGERPTRQQLNECERLEIAA